MDKIEFEKKVQALTGSEAELSRASDDEVEWRLGVAQHASDILINEAERRGLAGYEEGGHPFIPAKLPDGVEPVETLLTRVEPLHEKLRRLGEQLA